MENGRFDVRARLQAYLPSLFELLDENKINWKTIERNFHKRFNLLSKQYEVTQEPIRIEASLYDIIAAALQGKREAFNLLDFIDKRLQELSQRLSSDEKRMVRKNVY